MRYKSGNHLMTSKSILFVALRIGAILILVNALEKFPLAFGYYQTETGVSFNAFFTMSIAPLLFSIIIACLMWFLLIGYLKRIERSIAFRCLVSAPTEM